MKHASSETLQSLLPLLEQLRKLPDLTERKPGIFYRKSAAFLHFHEDSQGIFADVKLGGRNFTRIDVSQRVRQVRFLEVVKLALQPAPSR